MGNQCQFEIIMEPLSTIMYYTQKHESSKSLSPAPLLILAHQQMLTSTQ